MGIWNSFTTWLTGRNGIYKDEDKINEAIQQLNAIVSSGGQIEEVKEKVQEAVKQLQSCTGFEQYVGHVESSAFDSVIEYTENGVNEVIKQINQIVEEIDEYNKGSAIQKVGGTLSLLTGKLGEGFLSVFEGVGDAVLTAGAWVTNVPKIWTHEDTAASKALQSAVKFDVSGALMSPLTSNSWASKYSAVTKDSGAASIVNGAGKALGYATMAGYISGASKAYQTASVAGRVGNVSKAAKFANKATGILTSTTNSSTLVAGASGFGQGTQTGLQSGKGLEGSTLQGAFQGATEAAIAYGAGKFGERSRIKSANNQIDDAVSNGRMTAEQATTAKEQAVQNIKSSGGYNDKVTKAAMRKGKADMNTIIDLHQAGAGKLKSVVEGTGKNLVRSSKEVLNAAAGAKNSLVENFTDKSLLAKATNKVTNTTTHEGTKLGKFLSGVARTTTDAATLGGKAVAAGVTTSTGGVAAGSAARLVTEATLGGTTNEVDRAVNLGINSDIASNQFQSRKATKNDLNYTGETESQLQSIDDYNGNNNSTPSYNPSGDNGYDPGNTNTGGQTSSADGYAPSVNPSGDSSTQFRTEDTTPPTTAAPTTSTDQSTPGTTAPGTSTPGTTVPDTSTPPTSASPSTTAPDTSAPTTIINTPGTTPNPTTTTTGGGTFHTGGGYTGTGGYTENNTILPTDSTTDTTTGLENVKDKLNDSTTSIEDVIKGSKYTKIPSTPSPVTTQKSSGGSSAVIPIAAGLSAAAAAGIGAKAYMDRKKNNDNGEDEEEFDTDEWSGDDSVDIQYDDSSDNENYLDADDDYSYQSQESSEKYDARSSDELADLQ